MGRRVLILALVLCTSVVGCSEDSGNRGSSGGDAGGDAAGGEASVESTLGHQAFQPSTRLVVPAGVGTPLDRVARVLAGLAEGPLGVRTFVDQRPGGGGFVAWRDVAAEEPEGYQLAYVTEGLLASGRSGEGGVGPGDFEMVAQTDTGSAVLVAKGDPEVETLQWEDFEDFGGFVDGAKKEPGLVEVADAGPGTVYREGTLALERELGVDLSPKSPTGKSPVQAIYDGDVETALVPFDWNVYSDVLAGELTPLVVLGEDRAPDLPDVPTAKELGYDVTVPVFGGVAAPSGTPSEVVDELGRAFVASSSSKTFERALVGAGREPFQRGPREFEDYFDEQARLLSAEGPETTERDQ